ERALSLSSPPRLIRMMITAAPAPFCGLLAPSRRCSAPCRRPSHLGRRRFAGQTRGGRYYRARYYHPAMSRFISEDPLPSPRNLYAYARNNPVRYVDPRGAAEIRSEERRVGKECRSRWSSDHENKRVLRHLAHYT